MGADIFTMGVDVGSTASKCLILKNGKEIAGSAVVPAGTGTSGPGRAVAAALAEAGIGREDVAFVTATGYGRNTFPGADAVVSEFNFKNKFNVFFFILFILNFYVIFIFYSFKFY